MRFLFLLSILFATPLAAFTPGDVYFEHRSSLPSSNGAYFEAWQYEPQWRYALAADAWPLIDKVVPLFGAGHFFVPASNLVVFHSDRTVSFWDGVPHIFTEPGLGYTEIFRDDADLGEIAPMRPGLYLVPELGAKNAKLIAFTLQGRIAEYPFPNGIGAEHIELLADQCTLLYGLGNRVARMNLCTGQALADFATLAAGQMAGAIRKTPNGDVLVADGSQVLRFNAGGALLMTYPFAGVTHVALTPDGTSFWAAGVNAGVAELRSYGAGNDIPIGNPEMTSATTPLEANDLVVVGEWRAAAQAKIRLRAKR